jgi:lipopolysaccharide transport system permease protein
MQALARGVHELLGAVSLKDTWAYSGLQDIRLRYRRSFLGPWWLTLSTAITIAVLGVLWSKIFEMDIAEYLPFFAVGHVIWTWISAQLNDACAGFTQFEHIIKQTRLPYPTYLLRLSIRHTLILAHNAVVVAAVLLFAGTGFHAVSWLALIGVALVFVICVLVAIVLAIGCARYRDLQPLIASGLQIAFFVTPILWQPGALRSAAWMAELNPLFHWIELIRQPLLGHLPAAAHYWWTGASMAVLGAVSLWLLGRERDRIAYWM